MNTNHWRFLTHYLAGLGLTMGAAHALEMPQKLAYSPELYTAVNSTLYRYFAVVGGFVMVAGILAAAVLAYRVRGEASFGWTLAGAVCLAVSFGLWLALVAPVNGAVAEVTRAAPEAVPALWFRLRGRWEYGHLASFVAWLAGFKLLLWATVRQIPNPTGAASFQPEAARHSRRSPA